jgi:hypothetical protein
MGRLRTLSVFRKRAGTSPREGVMQQATRQAEAGRRLAIYELGSGFLAPWYMRLRVSEECARARRYGRPLSVIVIEPAAGDQGDALKRWLQQGLRGTDLVCHTLEGQYIALLTETDGPGAAEVMKRILGAARVVSIHSASFLTDQTRFMGLVAGLDRTWAAA